MIHCMRIKCPAEAEYSIKALVPAKGHSFFECSPVEVFCGLRLCFACAERAKPADIFTTEMKDCISDMMSAQSDAVPDFKNTLLQVIAMDNIELLSIEASNATIH
jgi:hypothetical protein